MNKKSRTDRQTDGHTDRLTTALTTIPLQPLGHGVINSYSSIILLNIWNWNVKISINSTIIFLCLLSHQCIPGILWLREVLPQIRLSFDMGSFPWLSQIGHYPLEGRDSPNPLAITPACREHYLVSHSSSLLAERAVNPRAAAMPPIGPQLNYSR